MIRSAAEEDLRSIAASIPPLDQGAMERARRRQRELVKPPGSLGRLEEIAMNVAGFADPFGLGPSWHCRQDQAQGC